MEALILLLALQQVPGEPSEAPSSVPYRDLFGVSIDRAGDLDGDGVEDLWIGDPSASETGDERYAAVWAVSGATGEALRRIAAPRGTVEFGATVCALGDIDGDGVGDVAVGSVSLAPENGHQPAAGSERAAPETEGGVFLLSGANGSIRWALRGPADDWKVPWYTAVAGPALCAVGDWNQDGVDDVAIGWARADAEHDDCGRVVVVSGADGSPLRSWHGDASHDRLGSVLCAVGDLDGDGRTELAAAAHPDRGVRYEPRDRAGRVVVLSSGGSVRCVLRPADDSRGFGLSLARFPDVDGDGLDELLAGQPFLGDPRGAIRLFSLAGPELLRTIPQPALEDWSGGWERGLVHPPPESVDRSFGARFLVVPDRDEDGLADVLATVPQAFGYVPAGVLSSRTGRPLAHLRVAISDPSKGHDYSHIGLSACALGDVDGDGVEDLALGGASVRCDACQGSVLVVTGRELRPLRRIVGAELRR